MNNEIHVSVSILVSSGYMPGSGIAGLYGGFIPRFLRNLHTFFHSMEVAELIYIPTNSARLFPFSAPFPAFIVCRLFEEGHSDWCEMLSHCSFDLYFSHNERCWASFHVFVSHLYIFFGKMSAQVFCPIFDFFACLFVLILSCLYILNINPSLIASFANIFSHPVGVVF